MSESSAVTQAGESQMVVAVHQVKHSLMDQHEKFAKFCQMLQEARDRMIEKVEGGSGSPEIRLEGGSDVAADLVSFESILSFLRCKFRVHDKVSGELPGLVEVEAEDREYVSKWCSFLVNVEHKLSDSGRCEGELLRLFSNFDLGPINPIELRVVVVNLIAEYSDLMHEFDSLFPLRDHENEDVGSTSDRSSDGAAEEKVSGEKTSEEEVSDESMGLVEAEEGVDKEVLSKWCGFLAKVGRKLSDSGRNKYDLIRQFSHFNLGLINQVELGVVVTHMIQEYPDLMQEFVSLMPHEDGSNSDHSLESAEENGTTRKRKTVAEAPDKGSSTVAKQRTMRCREITDDEEDNMCFADVRKGQLAGAVAYASHILHGASDTNEWSHNWEARKAHLARIVKEMYDNKGSKVVAMVEEDPANTLPAVMSRLQQKEQEHKSRRDARIRAQAYGK